MKRSIVATILAATVLVSMVGMASAQDKLGINVDPVWQNISVGATGTYVVTITVPDNAVNKTHTIGFNTHNVSLLANMTGTTVDTGALATVDNGTWVPTSSGDYIFTYTVEPQSGIITDVIYGMSLEDSYEDGWVGKDPSATVVAGVNPTPELATIAFVGIGLIGLVALGRQRT